MGVEDAARINAVAVAVQVFIGEQIEDQSVHDMTRLVDPGRRYGVPVLAVTAVGKELTRDARYLGWPPGSAPARRAHHQDLLLRRGLRHGRRGLPGAAGDGGREETANWTP